MHVYDTYTFNLINTLVAGNHANTEGSGLWVGEEYPRIVDRGRLLHTTIVDNRGSGQGVYVAPYIALAFTNTILAGHSGGGISVTAGSTVTLENTLWYNNGADIGGAGTIISHTSLIGDPAFVNPAAWDYHLGPHSAAVDAGVDAGVTTDLDGNPRSDLAPDIGAYERQYSDGDKVIKSGFKGRIPVSFGPMWVRLTPSADDAGTMTVTKHLTYPGGTYDAGEIKVTWHLTGTLDAGLPVTLSLCYTADELGTLDADHLEMFRWNGSRWVDMDATPDPAHHCVILAGVGQFSMWTLKDTSVGGDAPTAVHLQSIVVRGGLWLLESILLALGAIGVWRRK